MATSTLVFNDSADVNSITTDASYQPRYADSRSHLASSPREVPSDRMEIERRSLLNMGYSIVVIDTILASRKESTIRIYNVTWKAFHRWCRRKSVDTLSPPIPDVLKFLQEGLSSGLKPATLRKQVTALSSVLSPSGEVTLNKYPHICRFLRGATLRNPPQVHRFHTWRLHTVLSALTKHPFEPIAEIPLNWLRMKTLFLVAVTSAR